MSNFNEQIRDLIILRQLAIESYKTNIANKTAKVYKTIFDDLIKQIKTQDEINIKNMNQIIKELQQRIKPDLPLYTELNQLVSVEASYIVGSFNSIAGAVILDRIPKDSTLLKIVNTAIFTEETGKKFNLGQGIDGLNKTIKKMISDEIKQGVIQGEAIEQIAKRLTKDSLISQQYAKSFARTFTGVVVNSVRDEVYSENIDIFEGYQHISTLDTKTTEICMVRDNLTWSIDKKPIGHNLPYKQPPLHYSCRSILVPLVKPYELLDNEAIPKGTRSSMDGKVPQDTDFQTWLKKQDKARIEKALGKGRAQLFIDGKITISDLLNKNGTVRTLAQLKEKYE